MVGLPNVVLGYTGVADVTFSWGESANPVTWSWRLQNSLPAVTNQTLFSTLPGSNQVSYFNSDFATSAGCTSAAPGGATSVVARKYGCRYEGAGGLAFFPLPPSATDTGPAGAQATGTLYFTDTTLTGQLAIGVTTDEPTGGTATSVGDGAGAFNLRTEDTSVFGNAWYGASTAATLTVDLTGTFTAAGWEITGGTVRFTDPGFQCQQGGIGGGAGGALCSPTSSLPGSYSADGSHLSFGVDTNGGVAAGAMAEIEIWDEAGTGLVSTLSGVLASLSVGPGGVLATTTGEYRSGRGDGDTCTSKLRWNGLRLVCGTLTVGTLEITGTATPVDTEPDPFSFPSQANLSLGALATSAPATITGIAAPSRVTVSGGQYSIGCTATYTASASNIPDGSTVCVRHSSAATPATDTVTTLNVGGIIATFTSTTVPADTTPEPFSFASQADVAASAAITSGAATIIGINGAAPLSVSGGEYSVGCSDLFTAAAGSVNPGQTVCVRHSSASTPLTATDTTLTVGGVSATFTSTTAAAAPDTTPDAFSFAGQVDVALSTAVTSAPVTITGVGVAAPVTVAGGSYAVGCIEPFGSAPGSVINGQTICVRHTSAAASSSTVGTTLTVGGVSATFTSTTVAAGPPDTTPDPFAFADQIDVALNVPVTSAPVTMAGLTTAAPVAVSGGDYSIGCTGTFVATAGTVANGQAICVRHTSAAANGSQVSTILTVGGVSDSFTSTTAGYAVDDAATTPAGQPVVIDVLQNDNSLAPTVYVGIWISPVHGTATVSGAPGSPSGIRVTYTPNPGFSGTDSFEYWVETGLAVDYGVVSVTVINADPDGDGVVSSLDNCTLVSNPNQCDSDGDGYGNRCDGDLTNNGFTNAQDSVVLRSKLGTASSAPAFNVADLNCNGFVNAQDSVLLRQLLGQPPGPSGLVP